MTLRRAALLTLAVLSALAIPASADDPLACVWLPQGPVCVERPPMRQPPPCRVNVGYCAPGSYCQVNVGYCAPGGSCVVNVGYCDDSDLPVGV